MEETLLSKVTNENLEKLFDALYDVIEEMDNVQPNQEVCFADEVYDKCLSLTADITKAMSGKSK